MPGFSHPTLGRWVSQICTAVATRRLAKAGMFSADTPAGNQILASLRQRVQSGETCYVVGLGISGHNTGTSLVQVSRSGGIQLLSNDEEERFTGIKHYPDYPVHTIDELNHRLKLRGLKPAQVAAWTLSWDYSLWEGLFMRSFVGGLPDSLAVLRPGAMGSFAGKGPNARQDVTRAPFRIQKQLGLDEAPPLLMLPHHENHAAFAYAVSPFAKNGRLTVVGVVDGAGDQGSISSYQSDEHGRLRKLYSNQSLFDSLGFFYSVISATQGGWKILSSEGRYMGAAAWGDQSRLTNPYYRRFRDIFQFGSSGQIFLNRQMANWQNATTVEPYKPALSDIIGPPIPEDRMWNPDAVLNVENVKHSKITRRRVDLAAATQLIFEDGLFHIMEHLIRSTGSDQLVLTGGCALNGPANMKLIEHFDRGWYMRNVDRDTRLKLWVPPVTNDPGVVVGSAYSAALRADVPLGPSLQHAAWCGIPAETSTIQSALGNEPDVGYQQLGHVGNDAERRNVADLMAYIIERDGLLGIYQGAAETGPRALGQRSILANPCNPETRRVLNERVKFRELIRPLAPMVTREQADRYFDLSDGAAADDYNAYRYMVLTTKARPLAHHRIPAVVHKDGTSRIQIVNSDDNPLIHDFLKAMGRRVGVQVSVNTSLNVGGPICQTPLQALSVLKRAKGLTGLILVSAQGDMFLAWHAVKSEYKDNGLQLQQWMTEHSAAPRFRSRDAR